MAQKPKSDQLKLIRLAALELAAKDGWNGLALADVARAARLPQATVAALYSDTWAIVLDVLKILDSDAAARSAQTLGGSWRDNLFEILMTRFDLAQRQRDAFASILPAATLHPCVLRRFTRPFVAVVRGMLRQSGLEAGLRRPLFVAALGALYLSLIKTWQEDDTPDMAKTMAALDKRLGYFEQLVNAGRRKPAAA